MTKRKTQRTTQRKPSSNGQFVDGTITIEVQGGPHDGQTLSMDATVVKLAAEDLQHKHKLEVKDGVIEATAGFALDLDKKLKEMGYKSTPTIAIHAWIKSCSYFAELQKKTSQSPS